MKDLIRKGKNMKKNFISVLILGCTIINMVLCAITMFSVVSTNAQTAKVVSTVSRVLNVDLSSSSPDGDATIPTVPIEDIEVYSLEEAVRVNVYSEDGTSHTCVASVFFSINTKHKDYKKYGSLISTNEVVFRSIVSEVMQEYSLEELRANQDKVCKEILKKVQDKYSGSDMIFDVSFSDINFV